MKKRLISYFVIITVFLTGFIVILKNPMMSPTLTKSLPFKIQKDDLQDHVKYLSGLQPARSYSRLESLNKAGFYIEDQLTKAGITSERQSFEADGEKYFNVRLRLNAKSKKPLVVIGAHYDSAYDHPGADDNASGTAGLIEVTKALFQNQDQLPYPVEIVFYTLEEPPYFGSVDMGSFRHAKWITKDQNEKVEYMISLEMLGYFSDERGSQDFPLFALNWLYPNRGNFIALVGQMTDWITTRKLKRLMMATNGLQVQSINGPTFIEGLSSSDHLNYWEYDIPSFMVTDTAYYRNKNYHTPEDTWDKLNYDRMKQVVEKVVYSTLNYKP